MNLQYIPDPHFSRDANRFVEDLRSFRKTPGIFCSLFYCFICGLPCCLQGYTVYRSADKSCILRSLLPICLGPFGAAINRGTIRKYYKIEGTFTQDCLTHCGCCLCACNQELLEMVARKGKVTSNLFLGHPVLFNNDRSDSTDMAQLLKTSKASFY